MSSRPALNPGPEDTEGALRRRIEKLQDELEAMEAQCKAEIAKARMDVKAQLRGIAAIKAQMEPWYNAMRLLFEQIDAAGIPDTAVPPINSTSNVGSSAQSGNPRWEAWKQKLGRSPARVIDSLLIHGSLSLDQLVVFSDLDRRTVKAAIVSMNKADLLIKDGGKFGTYSLKPL